VIEDQSINRSIDQLADLSKYW